MCTWDFFKLTCPISHCLNISFYLSILLLMAICIISSLGIVGIECLNVLERVFCSLPSNFSKCLLHVLINMWYSPIFLILAILVCGWWCYIVILFCISLITNEIEYHFYMLISHSMFFIVKRFFCSFLYWIGCFSLINV